MPTTRVCILIVLLLCGNQCTAAGVSGMFIEWNRKPTVPPGLWKKALCLQGEAVKDILRTHPDDLLYQHPAKNRVLQELPPAMAYAYVLYARNRYGNIASLEVLERGLEWGIYEKFVQGFSKEDIRPDIPWWNMYVLKRLGLSFAKLFPWMAVGSVAGYVTALNIQNSMLRIRNLENKMGIFQRLLEQYPRQVAERVIPR